MGGYNGIKNLKSALGQYSNTEREHTSIDEAVSPNGDDGGRQGQSPETRMPGGKAKTCACGLTSAPLMSRQPAFEHL